MPQNTPTVNNNRDFLELVFGEDWPYAEVCSVPALGQDEDYKSYWNTRPAGGCVHTLDPDWNNYFCVSTMTVPGVRRKSHFKALRVLVVDDVGPKVDPAVALNVLGKPTYQIETSPGNQQWGYVLDPPITDLARAESLIPRTIQALADGKDPGMAGVTRLMRLPFGSNTKYTPAHTVRIVASDGPVRDPADLERGLPMLPGAVPIAQPDPNPDPFDLGGTQALGPSQPVRSAMGPVPGPAPVPGRGQGQADPTLRAMRRLGLVQGNERRASQGTGWDVRCPWVHEHTPSTAVDTGTFYFRGGGFKCWHGHCDRRSPEDVRARVNELLSEATGGLFTLDDFDPNKLDVVDPTQVPASPLPPEPDIVREVREDTVYHATDDRFLSLRNDHAVYKDRAFDTVWGPLLRDHMPLDAKKRPMSVSSWIRAVPGRVIVQGRAWWPNRDRLFASAEHGQTTRFLNTWREPHRSLLNDPLSGLDPLNDTGVIGDWYRLQALLFDAGTREGDENLEHWLDYQSMIVGATGVKPGHNPLLIGVQGAGKEIMLRPVMDFLGPSRYRQIEQEDLKGGFTDWIANRLVILPEVYRPTRWNRHGMDEYQRIKAFCDPGKPFMPMNRKYEGVIQVRNVFVLVMTSNEDRPLSLPPDDRRIWVVRVKETGWPVARFQALARGFTEPSPWGGTHGEAIVEWLIRRWDARTMLDKVTGHAPATREKAALIDRSRSEIEIWVEQLLARKLPDPLTLPEVFAGRRVMERIDNAGTIGGEGLPMGTRSPGENGIGRILRKLGCVPLNSEQAVPHPNGVSRRLWARPGDTVFVKMTERELMDWLDANQWG